MLAEMAYQLVQDPRAACLITRASVVVVEGEVLGTQGRCSKPLVVVGVIPQARIPVLARTPATERGVASPVAACADAVDHAVPPPFVTSASTTHRSATSVT